MCVSARVQGLALRPGACTLRHGNATGLIKEGSTGGGAECQGLVLPAHEISAGGVPPAHAPVPVAAVLDVLIEPIQKPHEKSVSEDIPEMPLLRNG